MKDMQQATSAVVYRRLLKYLKPYRRRFFCALGAMLVYGSTDGLIPFLLKKILDDIFGARNKQMLWWLMIAIVVFAVVRGIFGFLQRYLAATVGLYIIKDLRNEITQRLLSLSPSFFTRHSTGSLIARMTNDTLLVRTALTDAAAAMIRDSIRIVALLVAAFYLDPFLALIAFVGLPIAFYPVVRFGRKVRRLSRIGQDQFGGLTAILQETIVGQKVIRAFSMESFEQKRFARENEKATETLRKAEKYGALSAPTNEIVASFAIALVIFYGGISVISGVRTAGDFIAFIAAMFLLYEPVKKLSRINNTVQSGVAASERIFELLDAESDVVEKPDAKLLPLTKARIEYRDVSFKYSEQPSNGKEAEDEKRPWIIKNVSLEIEPGETVALVGMSGGGKSTLVSLLLRLYDPRQGEIFIDGTDIGDVTLSSLRQSIALVDQHTFLFNDTVFNNIAYGKVGASEDAIVNAAKAANAHEFILTLPYGYQTVIGDLGLRLSGGERARISIARALLKDAPILILDEATASLDSESEKLVQDAIDCLMKGRTVLVIAHRLATIRKADKIAVMIRGQLVELGSHNQLLARDGEYAKLYRLQFRDEGASEGASDKTPKVHAVR